MIIDNTYFIGEIYIPHAKPSITDAVTEVGGEVKLFIETYVPKCLSRTLGPQLFRELENVLDPSQPSGIDLAAEAKWDALLNGTEYTDPSTGDTVVWRGIRFKSSPLSEYNKSFLANYVYFFYEKNDHITRSDIGHQMEDGKNSRTVVPGIKVTDAWNTFVDLVQGADYRPSLISKGGMPGIDWYNSEANQEISLYKFIKDSNIILNNTYSNFRPTILSRINAFGL